MCELISSIRIHNALVAQLDRASGYELEGREFESLRARQIRKATQTRCFFVLIACILQTTETLCMSSSPSASPRPVIASPSIRLAALVYDGLLVLALMVLVGTILVILGTSHQTSVTGQAGKLSEAYRYGVIFPAFVLVTWWFYGLFWKRTGQTLGMQTWRLKTMRPDGGLLNWRLSILRCACACLLPVVCALMGYFLQRTPIAMLTSFILGFLFNYVFAVVNHRRLAVHDLLSGTVTVRLPPRPPSQWWLRIQAKFGAKH
jgi:uncharacterized RDD family membrane protein YckC